VTREGRLADRALAVLRRNDAGVYTKPSQSSYPFQWNWDSAFVALGLARVDVERGRTEVRSLLSGQWADGMVPHIVFHPQPVDYSPGPEFWASSACPGAPAVATSGLTQPPVLATAVRALHEAAPDAAFLEEVVPALERWHLWLHRERGDSRIGLVVILHPWESADDAPRFDGALARVEPAEFERSDTRHLDAAERPTDDQYRRYAAIVDGLRRFGYRPSSVADAPFAYVDVCFNAVLAVAEDDLALLWRELGADGSRAASDARRLRETLAARWTGDGDTVGDLLPLYAGVLDERQARLLHSTVLWSPDRFGPSASAPWAVTTVSKSSPDFDARRYWRGPVWINMNWFLVRGLERNGLAAEADELRRLTLDLVERSGFAEYYHPATGEPLGSAGFSWSAALTLDLL
jgi:glycogen debranching enzyme